MCLVQAKELVSAKEAGNGRENLHDDVAADDDRENQLLEEALDDPRIDSLGAHEELRRDAQLAEEVAEEFDAFKRVQLFVVPHLALSV